MLQTSLGTTHLSVVNASSAEEIINECPRCGYRIRRLYRGRIGSRPSSQESARLRGGFDQQREVESVLRGGKGCTRQNPLLLLGRACRECRDRWPEIHQTACGL